MNKPCNKCSSIGTVSLRGIAYKLYSCNNEWIHFSFPDTLDLVGSCLISKALKIKVSRPDNWLDEVFVKGYDLIQEQAS